MTRYPHLLLCALLILAPFLHGCAAAPGQDSPAVFSIAADQYELAFARSKDILRRRGFQLDRVDAARGIITTAPAPAAGFLSPWIQHAQSLPAAVEDTIQPTRRVAIVHFQPADGAAAGSLEEPSSQSFPSGDLRRFPGPLLGIVEVQRLRLYRPWRRFDATSIRLRTSSPISGAAVGEPVEAGLLRVGPDSGLAEALAETIAADVGRNDG